MTEIQLDKEITFNLPEGAYAAQLSGINTFNKQTAKGRQDWIRLLFDVTVPGMLELDCRAGERDHFSGPLMC